MGDNDHPGPTMNAETFYEREYVALRDKVERKTEDMGKLQIYAAGSSAAVL